jgi:HAD superfamily hydrolase (TIGR01549 family)
VSDPAAVCFDLDGTLCESDQSLAEIHRETFERAGVEPFFSPSDVQAVPDDAVETAETAPEFYRNLFAATVARLDADTDTAGPVDPDDETLWDLGEAATEVVDARAVSWRDGAEAALDYVRERYTVGLVTNGGQQTQTAKLNRLGITDAFETTVFCDPAAGIDPKPAATPFEVALSELGVSPAETLYVGNSFAADVVGARDVGLDVVWIPDDGAAEPPEKSSVEPTHRLDSLTDLPTVL